MERRRNHSARFNRPEDKAGELEAKQVKDHEERVIHVLGANDVREMEVLAKELEVPDLVTANPVA